MTHPTLRLAPLSLLLLSALPAGLHRTQGVLEFGLDTEEGLRGLDPRGVELELTRFLNQPCLGVRESEPGQADAVVLLPGTDFENGTIEVELNGRPRPDAAPGMRGFIGVAFRLQGDASGMRYDCLYLRPTNSRAEEQLRRNHTTQYVCHPEFPWHRLRADQPGEYESYADLDLEGWTRLRIVVRDSRAELFVGAGEQPTLIVRDLRGEPHGLVGLWIGMGTEARFRNLRIQRE